MYRDFILLAFSLSAWGTLLNSNNVALGLGLLFIGIKLGTVFNIWQWRLPTKQIHRWGDVSTLLIIFLLITLYLVQPIDRPMFTFLKCFPILFAPVLIAQLLSGQAQIPLSTLFYTLRRKNRATNQTINFQLYYAAITLLSGGAANVKTPLFFILSVLFFVALLWFMRPSQSRLYWWLPMFALVIIVSYIGQQALWQLHGFVEQKSIQWLSGLNIDPFKTQTSIGDIGELKLSSRIEFRLKAEGQLLLHQASYDHYFGQTWIASKRLFSTKNPETNNQQPLKQLTVFQHNLANTVLALPDGTVQINDLEQADFHYTELGAVRVEIPKQTTNYHVFYTGKRTLKPNRYDLDVPKIHKDWLQQVSEELKLKQLQPKAKAERIKDYFHQHYKYTLYLGTETDANRALRDFILRRKAGHCEYFAEATVFLLRQNGIPARFATGYSVSEYIPEHDLYLVRSRDAHAWAIAYVDGVWQAVDSTPAQWQDIEAENANAVWQTLTDTWSNALFLWQQWHVNSEQRLAIKYTVLVLFILYIGKRLFKRVQIILATKKEQMQLLPRQGLDSEFYQLEQYLQHTEQARFADESLQQWVERLAMPELMALCRLHYQLRFDPLGLTESERQQLRQQVNFCLTKLTKN